MEEQEEEKDKVEKSNHLKWAEREIELLLNRERKGAEKDNDEAGFDYVRGCAENALDAFKELERADHSGMSIGITHSILNHLIDHKPLTPLTGADDEWVQCSFCDRNGGAVFQNKRCPSVFKTVNADGSVKYNDGDRFVGINIDRPHGGWHFGLLAEVLEENDLEFPPVTMPYMPPKEPIKVTFREILTDEKNGDFDTTQILDAYTTDKNTGLPKIVPIRRQYDLSVEPPREISYQEWCEKCAKAIDLVAKKEAEKSGFPKEYDLGQNAVAPEEG